MEIKALNAPTVAVVDSCTLETFGNIYNIVFRLLIVLPSSDNVVTLLRYHIIVLCHVFHRFLSLH
jgi:hypothetical protein